MKRFARCHLPVLCCLLYLFSLLETALGEEAIFYRAINLNGPAVQIGGLPWESGLAAKGFKPNGNKLDSPNVPLKPPTEASRAQMLRSSVWGGKVDIELSKVPSGIYQVFLHVWEDNNNESYDILLNGRTVHQGFQSGTMGVWKRLGPWASESVDGKLTLSTHGGAANLSGLEVWAGSGEIPDLSARAFADAATDEQLAFFEKRIRPVLAEHCYGCHSAGAEKLKGGLLLDSRAGVRTGGDSGPVIIPGYPEASMLILALRHSDADFAMPPQKPKLSAEIIADFEQWIREGVPDPRSEDTVAAVKARERIDWDEARQWWSFRPLVAPSVPSVTQTSWPQTAVDRFILAKLEGAGMTPAPAADRRVLIRRATFDLIGLPPTPEEVDDFLADTSPTAFANVIERLLKSPRYGERWGRHWLDVVRYADTAGDNSDFPIPQVHRYRDWVIDAFNRDLPYDEFVRDQLAGDLRGGVTDEERNARIVATGYIANARRFGSRVDDYPQHLTIEDTLDNLGRSFLGITVSCARCHDHKFDPIPTKDYYALYGIFKSTRYPWPGIELDQKQRDFVPLTPSGELVYGVTEAKEVGDVAVQVKGDPTKLGPMVPRQFLTVLGGATLPEKSETSGRAELTEWILAPDNPLPARVMANRLWLYHFGRGIVATPNDFGKQGKPPTHPELLDYLATAFRDSAWSIKAMHRLIMLSNTYQMASERDPATMERDPNNQLIEAFPRIRLDAEAIRDSLLALGGSLDTSPAGPHPFPEQKTWKFTQHHPFKAVYETNRRSVYLMTQRIQRHPYLAIFDGADPSASTPARTTSTTPLQALYFLNDPFVHQQAQRVAESILSFHSDDAIRLQRVYEVLFSRRAKPDEIAAAQDFLERAHASTSGDTLAVWSAYVRVLFRLNEFVYLD